MDGPSALEAIAVDYTKSLGLLSAITSHSFGVVDITRLVFSNKDDGLLYCWVTYSFPVIFWRQDSVFKQNILLDVVLGFTTLLNVTQDQKDYLIPKRRFPLSRKL